MRCKVRDHLLQDGSKDFDKFFPRVRLVLNESCKSVRSRKRYLPLLRIRKRRVFSVFLGDERSFLDSYLPYNKRLFVERVGVKPTREICPAPKACQRFSERPDKVLPLELTVGK